ncbi:carbon-nitrogen hydrolase family protein [Helicobacter sp. MIT 21-1697]|uniref:carbon-nitrogen hydrolase family protein n=1 Tax=Helicobacter sp. MIT 21-1697 TaxID=2993733 RepID=UPI00224AABD5|nr:carbon-nitrogen hydrolase family protein [Helicobacter sp. MIT 21-1697]MCX2717865.1 carbon-nitrogen hydrolase family protein [Helicobacter sp. MIT 21-1697]
MNVALLQLPSLMFADTKLEKYLQKCKEKKVKLVALGEYVLHPFFKEFDSIDSKKISLANDTLPTLHKLSKKYKLDIIAPLLVREHNKLYKTIALIQNDKAHIYHQQKLIAYEHWNEKSFFDNKIPKSPQIPLTFEKDGFKIGIVAGFEIHFDEIWLKLKKAQVDVVFLLCSNTFNSKTRWRNLCQMRAFLNSMVILRVNRVGEMYYEQTLWRFYGDSLFINANGHIEESLGDKEEMLVVELDLAQIRHIQKEWQFREIAQF